MHTPELPVAHRWAAASPIRASTPSPRKPGRRLAATLSVLSISLVLAACGGGEMVKGDNLALGASSIDMARAAGGDEFAPVEMNKARAKLERARRMLQDGKRVEAQRLADEADVDAQVAHAKAGSVRSAQSLAEVKESIRALRQQSEQAAQPNAAPAIAR